MRKASALGVMTVALLTCNTCMAQWDDLYIGLRAGLADIAYKDIAKNLLLNQSFSDVVLEQYSNLASVSLEFYIPKGKHGLIQFEGNYRFSDPESGFVGKKEYSLVTDTATPKVKVKSEYYYFRMSYGLNLFTESRFIVHILIGADFGFGKDIQFNDAANLYSNYYASNNNSWSSGSGSYNSGSGSWQGTGNSQNTYNYYNQGNYIVPNSDYNVYLGVTARLNVGFYLKPDKSKALVISPSLSSLWNIKANEDRPITPDISVT